ncbi:MAG TPA: helicase, partial [Deltaproteobacteria bacterium]|nr:helicase [Deltaproteobacteria bacterium]
MSDARVAVDAARLLRSAISEVDGDEVFAIGDVEDGQIVRVEITCRGTQDQVPALLGRPRPGQVVIHNHPSGNLQPSEADLHLAGRYGEAGVGVVIVDNTVERSRWVVEPHVSAAVAVPDADVDRVFQVALPRVMPGHEARSGQLDMARSVARSLNENEISILEAGTGTGKSLAYLVPAALWAKANNSKVVVATHTLTLQGQLASSDLPVLKKAGVDASWATL